MRSLNCNNPSLHSPSFCRCGWVQWSRALTKSHCGLCIVATFHYTLRHFAGVVERCGAGLERKVTTGCVL